MKIKHPRLGSWQSLLDKEKHPWKSLHYLEDAISDQEISAKGVQVIEYVESINIIHNHRKTTYNNITVPVPKKPPSPKRKDKSGVQKLGGGDKFRKADDDNLPTRAVDMLAKAQKSVGIIRGPGNLQGTGFLLKENLVMTAAHVVKDAKYGNPTKVKDLSIQFSYQQQADIANRDTLFKLAPEIEYENLDMDFIILKISSEEDIERKSSFLPDPFEHFSDVQPSMKGHMIGHPGGNPQVLDPNIKLYELTDEMFHQAKQWSELHYGVNGYNGVQDKKKILFHCRFDHGASGSPGVYADTTKEYCEVVWMLLEGYPGFYYTDLSSERKLEISNDFLIEQGITMKSIWNDMFNKKKDLYRKIFSHRDKTFALVS
ncbi:uncharacterized protein LOC132548224 isoform X2 [Ylistrum balloti]|uniref:uncharacterized protein LOC132548224 isoform X2 n=1 Tax=Ylistrum balloti TaxID=509963 RepID=UPI0029059935|nr:uncharacterized protein LOC132548224 isoform X2 [Ylistrum balloti]